MPYASLFLWYVCRASGLFRFPSFCSVWGSQNTNMLGKTACTVLQLAPPPTGSPGPFGPGTSEESKKSPERVPRSRAPRVPKECAPESQKSPKRVRNPGFRLLSDSVTPGRAPSGLLGPCSGVLFPDSFWTLLGFPGPKGPGDPCVGRGQQHAQCHCDH